LASSSRHHQVTFCQHNHCTKLPAQSLHKSNKPTQAVGRGYEDGVRVADVTCRISRSKLAEGQLSAAGVVFCCHQRPPVHHPIWYHRMNHATVLTVLCCDVMCRYQTGRLKAAQARVAAGGSSSSSKEHGSKAASDPGVVVTVLASSRSSSGSSRNSSWSSEGGVVTAGESRTSHGGSLPALRVKV
jgi:hypothetical protein